MEQPPTDNEEPRQLVAADLSAIDGLRTAVGYAESLLGGEQLEAFQQEIQLATAPGSNATPEDVLEIVNAYTELVDISGRYPAYTVEGKVTAAVGQLQEKVATLPPSVDAIVDSLWPDFDNPDTGIFAYSVLVHNEITRIQDEIASGDESQRESYEHYLMMLQECAAAFRRIGI